jgi:hypothetical protein
MRKVWLVMMMKSNNLRFAC